MTPVPLPVLLAIIMFACHNLYLLNIPLQRELLGSPVGGVLFPLYQSTRIASTLVDTYYPNERLKIAQGTLLSGGLWLGALWWTGHDRSPWLLLGGALSGATESFSWSIALARLDVLDAQHSRRRVTASIAVYCVAIGLASASSSGVYSQMGMLACVGAWLLGLGVEVVCLVLLRVEDEVPHAPPSPPHASPPAPHLRALQRSSTLMCLSSLDLNDGVGGGGGEGGLPGRQATTLDPLLRGTLLATCLTLGVEFSIVLLGAVHTHAQLGLPGEAWMLIAAMQLLAILAPLLSRQPWVFESQPGSLLAILALHVAVGATLASDVSSVVSLAALSTMGFLYVAGLIAASSTATVVGGRLGVPSSHVQLVLGHLALARNLGLLVGSVLLGLVDNTPLLFWVMVGCMAGCFLCLGAAFWRAGGGGG